MAAVTFRTERRKNFIIRKKSCPSKQQLQNTCKQAVDYATSVRPDGTVVLAANKQFS